MSYKSHLLDAKSKPTSCKSRSCPDYIISPLLLVADGQQERDEVPVNIWTQPTVRLTTYLMRMRTAVVIVKKSTIYRIKLLVSILIELFSTVMLSIDFPRRRLSSTPNEDDEDDFNKSPPAPFAPQPMNLYSTLALDINQHHNL